MTYYTNEFTRMRGVVLANQILEHSCWRCWVPFMQCTEQRQRSAELERIRTKLEKEEARGPSQHKQ